MLRVQWSHGGVVAVGSKKQQTPQKSFKQKNILANLHIVKSSFERTDGWILDDVNTPNSVPTMKQRKTVLKH